MKQSKNVQTVDDMVLLDSAFYEVNQEILSGLQWLHNAFGKCSKERRKKDGGFFEYPAIFTGRKNEYLPLFPDDSLGNFSFFDVGQRVEVTGWNKGMMPRINAEFGLIFWYNFKKVYDSEFRSSENIKNDILNVLKDIHSITIDEIVEHPSLVYAGYSHADVGSHNFERPYGVVRFNGEINWKCS